MGPYVIILISPSFHKDFCFSDRIKDFTVEHFIPQFAIKRYHIAVFPGTARSNIEGFHPQPCEPGSDWFGGKLCPVITPEIGWNAPLYEQRWETL